MYKVNFNTPVKVHFMGIGGISMSGLAEILVDAGFPVSGSDSTDSKIIASLRDKGVTVHIGQTANNITDDIELVVYTAAISKDNEELKEVIRRGLPMLTRAELLGQIMSNYKYGIAISGTHGKTTTTSMMSHILLHAKKDPTISIGGMLDVIGGNIRVGKSDYFVTEACEYTNSYHSLLPYISIILNVDADHLDFFKDIDEIAESFHTFAKLLPKNGLLVVNGDMNYADLVCDGVESNISTFGLSEGCDYTATNITYDDEGHPSYTLVVHGAKKCDITLHSTGLHNVCNSLSVIAVCDFLGIDMQDVKEGLLACTSAKRRFEKKGVTSGGITILDDYAHHPTEIKATIQAAKKLPYEEIWCVFQPHTYTRTAALLDDFADALSDCDHVLLADIYAAREKDTGLVSSQNLADKLTESGTTVTYLGDFDSIEKFIEKNCKKNYLLITMGAGNVDTIGDNLLKK